MNAIRTVVAALAVAAAVVLPVTGAAAADSRSDSGSQSRSDAGPAGAAGDLAAAAANQTATSLVDFANSFLFCDQARYDTMYPPAPFFTFDCMRGAPASNG
jgi:hypothetical protein